MWLTVLVAGCSPGNGSRFQGYVEGEYVLVAPDVNGALQSLDVQRGMRVSSGAPLFSLDPEPEASEVNEAEKRLARARANLEDLCKGDRPSEIAALKAQLAQARAALEYSKTELTRAEALARRKVIPPEDLDKASSTHEQDRERVNELSARLETATLGARTDQIAAARAEVNALEAALEQSRWKLGQKSQTAPANALVFDTLYEPGEWIAAGRPVVSLLPPGNIKVRFFVPETVVGTLQPGQGVKVHVDGLDGSLEGAISFISPEAEYTPPVIYSRESRSKLVFMIEAVFDPAVAARLHPGQPVDVSVSAASSSSSTSPSNPE